MRERSASNFSRWSYDEFFSALRRMWWVSGMWKNDLCRTPRSWAISSDQPRMYEIRVIAAAGVKLCSGVGVNAIAVAEHAIALILAVAALARGVRQSAQEFWRGMTATRDARGRSLARPAGRRMGRIGSHLAKLESLRHEGDRHPAGSRRAPTADRSTDGRSGEARVAAGIVVLTCSLTPETTGLMSAAAFADEAAAIPDVARGKVDEGPGRHDAGNRIAAAALVVTAENRRGPSPLWELPNVFITPHNAGETRAYEDNVIDIRSRTWNAFERRPVLRNRFLARYYFFSFRRQVLCRRSRMRRRRGLGGGRGMRAAPGPAAAERPEALTGGRRRLDVLRLSRPPPVHGRFGRMPGLYMPGLGGGATVPRPDAAAAALQPGWR